MAGNLGKPFAKWVKVIDWLKDNFTEPVYADCNSLEDTFGMVADGSRKDKMTFYLMCQQQNKDTLDKPLTARRFQVWYSHNQQYLPKDLRGLMNFNKKQGAPHPEHFCKATIEALEWFDEWLENMCNQIQVDLSQRYFTGGARRYFDILERRYRQNWGVNKETTIETKKSPDQEEVVVKFVEA